MHFSKSTSEIRRYPPELGEHTVEMVVEIGYEEEEIAAFGADDII